MIIASIHYINLPMGSSLNVMRGKSNFLLFAVDRIYRRYYEELKALVELGGFDVLGHFDHPRRYLLRLDHEDELIEGNHWYVGRKRNCSRNQYVTVAEGGSRNSAGKTDS